MVRLSHSAPRSSLFLSFSVFTFSLLLFVIFLHSHPRTSAFLPGATLPQKPHICQCCPWFSEGISPKSGEMQSCRLAQNVTLLCISFPLKNKNKNKNGVSEFVGKLRFQTNYAALLYQTCLNATCKQQFTDNNFAFFCTELRKELRKPETIVKTI